MVSISYRATHLDSRLVEPFTTARCAGTGKLGNKAYSFSHGPLLRYSCFTRRASHETANRTVHHRYCWSRESDRKLDPSRSIVRVFGLFLPLVGVFSSLMQYQFQKEEPPWVQNFMSADCPMRQLNHSSP